MEFALASAIGVLTSIGVYLLLRARSFDVILGMTFLSYATNLLIFSGGRLVQGKAPVLRPGIDSDLGNYTDPLPQALVLTAIVIAFAMTAVSIVLAMRSRSDNHSDHVDAHEPDDDLGASAPEPSATEPSMRAPSKADDAAGRGA